MPKYALILYCSRGGNTEKIAMKFKEVIERRDAPWGDWVCHALKVTRRTDWNNLPFTPPEEDYDLVLMGSLVINGVPANEILHGMGMGGMRLMRRRREGQPRGAAPITEPYGMRKGIAFVTYADGRRGTPEAWPSLNLLEMRMEDSRIMVVGKYCCTAGGHRVYRWASPNIIRDLMKVSLDEANDLLLRYRENPNYPEFADLTEEQRKVFEEEAHSDPHDGHTETFGPRDLIWDLSGKPNERDLMKAQYFLEEILENYWGGGVEAAPLCQYLCIA